MFICISPPYLVVGTAKSVFNNLNLLKNNDGTIDFLENSTKKSEITTATEAQFYKDLYKLYKANNTIIKNSFFLSADFSSIDQNTNVQNTANDIKLQDAYAEVTGKNDFVFVNNYILSDLANVVSSKQYAVWIKNNFEQNFFTLKFCDLSNNCKETMQMPLNIDKNQFKSDLHLFIKDAARLNEQVIMLSDISFENLYVNVINSNQKKMIEKNSAANDQKIKDLIEQIENLETQYSGILKLNKSIPVYRFIKAKGKKNKEPVWYYEKDKSDRFVVSDTTTYIRFFNNKVKDILIKGYLDSNKEQKFRVMNVSYSFTLRSFNNSKHYLPISPNDNDANKYYININDLFEYDNNDKSWNYSVRNKEYKIEPGKAIKLEQRKLMDFFTGVIFTDAFGLNNKNANNLLQAEARIKIPMWIYNFGYSTFFHSISTDINASLYNGFDETGRYITDVTTKIIDNDPTKVESFSINNFDLIKYNNFNAGISLNLYNIEFKGLSTEWSFGYGMRYYRSNLRYTVKNIGIEDYAKDYQLNALTHELITNLEIRPQLNFGADLNIAYNFLNSRGATDNVNINFKEDDNVRDRTSIRFQLNLYSKLNPDKSNDGIFARVGGFYHVGAKDFFPQILVGYATNLSSFVNSFKKTSK